MGSYKLLERSPIKQEAPISPRPLIKTLTGKKLLCFDLSPFSQRLIIKGCFSLIEKCLCVANSILKSGIHVRRVATTYISTHSPTATKQRRPEE